MTRRQAWYSSAAVLLAVWTMGCGNKQFPTAPVSGRVMFDGKSVSGGTITFTPANDDGSPREGRSAIGTIDSDGRFVLKTYDDGDGAIIGKHVVTYSPPEEGLDPETEFDDPDSPEAVAADKERAAAAKRANRVEFKLSVAKDSRIVEVKDVAENSIRISLRKKPATEEVNEGEFEREE